MSHVGIVRRPNRCQSLVDFKKYVQKGLIQEITQNVSVGYIEAPISSPLFLVEISNGIA